MRDRYQKSSNDKKQLLYCLSLSRTDGGNNPVMVAYYPVTEPYVPVANLPPKKLLHFIDLQKLNLMKYLFATIILSTISIICKAQNVGIGTQTPEDLLTVNAPTDSFGITHTNGIVSIATKISGVTPAGWLGTKTNHPFNIFTNKNAVPNVSFTTDGRSSFNSAINISGFFGGAVNLMQGSSQNGELSTFSSNFFIRAKQTTDFALIPGNILLQTPSGLTYTGNVGIGETNPDFKLNISDTKLTGGQTLVLKLKAVNPVLSFDNFSQRIGYITARTQNPPAGFYNGMVVGSQAGYPIQFSTNNYSLSMIIADNGNVGIGTANPTYKLSVNGNVRSKEVVVESGWADYVFENNYPLLSLKETEKFILANKHLPGIPTAKYIRENGLAVADLQTKMMAKIEELTLHIIELEKKIEAIEIKK